MKNPICTILLLLVGFYALGQNAKLGDRYYNQFSNSPKGMLNDFRPQPKEKVTSVYLYDFWRAGDIYLKDSTKFENVNIKVDLLLNILEIHLDDGVRELPLRNLLAVSFKSYSGEDEIFISGEALLGKGSLYYDNIFQVLVDADISLYSYSFAELIEPTNNQAISISIDNSAIVKKDFFFKYQDQLIEVKNKSKLKEEFNSLIGEEVNPIIKKAKINKEEDLIDLARKLNETVD